MHLTDREHQLLIDAIDKKTWSLTHVGQPDSPGSLREEYRRLRDKLNTVTRTRAYLARAILHIAHPTVTGPLPGQLSDRCPECGQVIHPLDGDVQVYVAHPDDTLTDAAGAVHDWEPHWLTPEDACHVIGLRPDGRPVVLIGCEGYWCLDPNRLGIADPSWQPAERTFAEALTRRLDDGTAWTEGFTTGEINRPAVQ